MYKLRAKIDLRDLFKGCEYTATGIYYDTDVDAYYKVQIGNEIVFYSTHHFELLGEI